MLLKGRNLYFNYPKEPSILNDFNIKIDRGERVVLLGPSGCGKSTLCQILGGYLTPASGAVLYENTPLSAKGYCPVQMIHQNPEKAANPRWRMTKTLKEGYYPEPELMVELGIQNDWLTRYPGELSGGELQRFMVARALSPETKVLLADEITTMLDACTQAQIWQIILKIVTRRNMGLLAVTHNQALAEKIGTRIINMVY